MTNENKFEELQEICRRNGRVCPQPRKWAEFTKIIWHKSDFEKPPAPLILAAWDSPILFKLLRMQEHLRYAEKHNRLLEAKLYLESLEEKDWFYDKNTIS